MLSIACGATARAYTSSPQAEIAVVASDATGKPVANARVLLFGESGPPGQCKTNDEGSCSFSRVLPGFYRIRVVAQGYTEAEKGIEVRYSTKSITWRAVLAGNLHTIARVSAQGDPLTETFNVNAGFGRLFVNLASEMNALGHASIAVSSGGSLIGASIEGRDPLLTNVAFNGVEVQSSAALSSIDVDALAAARESDRTATLDLSTLGPAPFPVFETDLIAGGDADKHMKGTAQGTAGRVGFAAALLYHLTGSPLSGQTYQDSSGYEYKHIGEYSSKAFDLRFDAPISQNWTLRVEEIPSSSVGRPISTLWSGPVPSGYGPGKDLVMTRGSVTSLGAMGYVKDWSIDASYNDFRSDEVDDFHNLVVDRTPAPYLTDTADDEVNAHIFGMRGLRDGTLNVNLTASSVTSVASMNSSVIGNQSTTRSDMRGIADVRYLSNSHHGRSFALGFIEATSTGAHQSASSITAKFTQVLAPQTQFFLDTDLGSNLGLFPSAASFDAPSSAQFNCAGSTVIAQAPNDLPSVPAKMAVRAGIAAQRPRSSFTLQAYDQRYSGIVLSGALVPLAREPAGFVPAGYAQALEVAFHTVGGCAGSPQTYFSQDVSGIGVDYRGIEANVAGHIGNRFVLALDAIGQAAILRTTDERLRGTASPYVIGQQLPNVEFYNASISGEYRASPALDFLMNAAFHARNNQFNLPAYTMVTLGGVAKLSSVASLDVVMTNATHQFADAFISPRYAQWLPAGNGSLFPTLATPLGSPLLYVTVDFRWQHEPKS